MSTRQETAERHSTVRQSRIRAVVTDIRGSGGRQYVVSFPREYSSDTLTDETSITFLLSEWRGSERPRAGQMVTLANVQLFERGWRAAQAYPITPLSSSKK